MATFFFRAESFGSDSGSTGHVGLSGGGKLLSWRDWISASLFNMEIRPRHTRQKSGEKPLHAVRLARYTSTLLLCSQVATAGVAYCRLLVAIAQTGSPFFTFSIPPRLSSFNGQRRSKYGFESSETFWKGGRCNVSGTGQQESNNALEVLSFRRNAFGTEYWLPCGLAVPRPACILT